MAHSKRTFPSHLQNQISHWEVYQIDAAGLYKAVKDNPDNAVTQLHLGPAPLANGPDVNPMRLFLPIIRCRFKRRNGVETSTLTEPKSLSRL